MLEKFASRKFWLTILGGIVAVSADTLGLSPETVREVVIMVVGYDIGQGIADGIGKKKKEKEPAKEIEP